MLGFWQPLVLFKAQSKISRRVACDRALLSARCHGGLCSRSPRSEIHLPSS